MSNDDTKRKLEEEFGKEKVLFDERKMIMHQIWQTTKENPLQ